MANIKKRLKKNKLIAKLAKKRMELRSTQEKKRRMRQVKADPLKANRELFVRHFGREPDLEDPKDFNEKSMWLVHNVYKDDPTVTRCVDKYEMRGYMQERGLGQLLPKVYGVWDKPSQIDWDALPDEFVLKCNHGCGCNIFCHDKAKLDRKAVIRQLNKWLRINFAYYYGEINYEHVKPRIFCEEFLDDGNVQPTDYKFLCFNGEPKLVMLCTDREKGAKFTFTDASYNRLLWETGYHAGGKLPSKPASFEEMLRYAREISAPFPFVRVDFYDIHGKLYVGELTFSPLGSTIDYIKEEGLRQMGEWLDISKEMERCHAETD